jgi:hypothetical protein
VNGFGGTFHQGEASFTLANDLVGTSVGNPGPGGAPPSTLAAIAAMQAVLANHSPIQAQVETGRLVIVAGDYRVIAVQSSR